MSRVFFFALVIAAAFAADDPWIKVESIKSGTEIRVLKRGSTQPVIGKFDEANSEHLVLVVKNEQVAIAKDQVDRLDYRPAGGRASVSSTTKQEDPAAAREPRGYGAPAGRGRHQHIYQRQFRVQARFRNPVPPSLGRP